MRTKIGAILLFLGFSTGLWAEEKPWRAPLQKGEVRHTLISLNYRIQTLYRADGTEDVYVLDRYSFEPVGNPELVSAEDVIEERWEDPVNLQVLRYDFEGKLLSQRFFKKEGQFRGEVFFDEARIQALRNYDVEDEELPIMPIDWDAIIFADENFTRDRIVRWSETRDYRIKTEYTVQGLIHERIAWNRHTGEKLDLNARIYTQPIQRDVVQNFRGFLEIHYNTLGEISAIRSWDRKTGRVLPPPESIPFSFRLERDHLSMDADEEQLYQRDWFDASSPIPPREIEPGESLFPEERRRWKVLESVAVDAFSAAKTKAEVNQAGHEDNASELFRLRARLRPGYHPVDFEYLKHGFAGSFQTSNQIKSTLFPLGGQTFGDFHHFTFEGRNTVFSRYDSQVDLRGGLRISDHSLKVEDGSRRVNWNQTTVTPVFGVRAFTIPAPGWKVLADARLSRFRLSGVDTNSLEGGISLQRQQGNLNYGLGYRMFGHKVYADRDTLSRVKVDQDFRGAYFSVGYDF